MESRATDAARPNLRQYVWNLWKWNAVCSSFTLVVQKETSPMSHPGMVPSKKTLLLEPEKVVKQVIENEQRAAQIAWTPYCILAVALLLTLVVARTVAVLSQAGERARFDSLVERTREQFQRAINGNLILLDSLRGLANAKLAIGKEQFHRYVDALQLKDRYPGVQGLGFALFVSQDQKAADIEKITTDDPSFHIWPDSRRTQWCPIVFLAPSDGRNDAAIGYDLGDDRTNFAALSSSEESGRPTASVQIHPAQLSATPNQPLFFLAAPVYWSERRPDTREERSKEFYGFVLCSFRLHDLFKSLSDSPLNPEVVFRVYDGMKPGEGGLLYDSASPVSSPSNTPAFASTGTLSIADRTWTVVFSSRSARSIRSSPPLNPPATLIGTLMSFLLFAVMRVQARARSAAGQHAEEQQSNEARFRRLVEQSLVGIYVIQSERFAYANPKMAEIFGCSQGELTSRSVFDFIAPESRAMAKDNMEKRLRGDVESIHYELRGLRRSGKEIDVEAHGGRVEYNGQPAILGCLMDVTDKKRIAEKAAWLSSFPERSPHPIIELDLAGAIHYSNPAAGRSFPNLETLGLRIPSWRGCARRRSLCSTARWTWCGAR